MGWRALRNDETQSPPELSVVSTSASLPILALSQRASTWLLCPRTVRERTSPLKVPVLEMPYSYKRTSSLPKLETPYSFKEPPPKYQCWRHPTAIREPLSTKYLCWRLPTAVQELPLQSTCAGDTLQLSLPPPSICAGDILQL